MDEKSTHDSSRSKEHLESESDQHSEQTSEQTMSQSDSKPEDVINPVPVVPVAGAMWTGQGKITMTIDLDNLQMPLLNTDKKRNKKKKNKGAKPVTDSGAYTQPMDTKPTPNPKTNDDEHKKKRGGHRKNKRKEAKNNPPASVRPYHQRPAAPQDGKVEGHNVVDTNNRAAF